MRRLPAPCQAFFPIVVRPSYRQSGSDPWGQRASCPLPAASLPVTKSDSLNHLIVADQCAMGLFTSVLAKAITRVYPKLDQPPVNVLAIFAPISWLRIALPFNFRAVGIEQRSLEPIPDDFLIVFRIRPAKSGVDILRQGADHKKAGDGKDQLHPSRKNKTTGIVDQKRCAFMGVPHSTGFPLQVNRARIFK